MNQKTPLEKIKKRLFLLFIATSVFRTDVHAQWNGTTVPTVTTSSSVGIGTLSPTDLLTVQDGDVALNSAGDVNYRNIKANTDAMSMNLFSRTSGGDGSAISLFGRNYSGSQGCIQFIANNDPLYSSPTQNAFRFLTFNGSSYSKILQVNKSGAVLIGNIPSFTGTSTLLAVEGLISCRELKVLPAGTAWPDYVFAKDYKMMSLHEVEAYVNENKHLPQFKSADIVEKNGITVGETETELVKSVEELYMHTIALEKRIDKLQEENNMLKQRMESAKK